MNEIEKAKSDKRNEETPPFTFRFVSKELKRGIERMAKQNHRTIAGELNAICEAAVAGGAK